MSPSPVEGVAGVLERVGTHLGFTEYEEVTQEQVALFARATGDDQWIHTDVERAERESPFGGPIAHGFLTLSQVVVVLPRLWELRGFSMGVNYGCERVRFPAPVPVGARLRAGALVDDAREIAGGVQITVTVTFEVEGGRKPACVATVVLRQYV
ncbi:MaoC family dehydratase [Spiractinospora alimapuensis]|uniref:MaoC family dehydratase n=1 Tax=Spiractinospora alimapuensis TaxID=2820884 RepID=UPI001F1AE2A0|nr:MaoC family dehydratase [Spiractinospora alimapuensis]QVQ52849.1 MaoC family dehydratase [Spiractinospora alimapuensis]